MAFADVETANAHVEFAFAHQEKPNPNVEMAFPGAHQVSLMGSVADQLVGGHESLALTGLVGENRLETITSG